MNETKTELREFEVWLERSVTYCDRFSVTIYAASEDDARELAEAMRNFPDPSQDRWVEEELIDVVEVVPVEEDEDEDEEDD